MALYKIAGLYVQMKLFGRSLEQAAPYKVSQGEMDFEIAPDAQQMLNSNPGMKTLDVAQYMATGAAFARELYNHDGFQLHASAVMLEGRAYLFSAPSGTGKSTHTEKWVRLFGATYLNDDKPALRLTKDGWYVYGTPWSGKHDLSSNAEAPLGGVAFLQRGTENSIQRLDPAEAIPYFISQLLRHIDAQQMDRQLSLLDKLLEKVPVYLLTCCNDDEAALVSRQAMEVKDGNN